MHRTSKIISLALGVGAAGMLTAAPAMAAPGLKLDKQDIHERACDSAGAKQLVDVHFKTINNYDSGFGGNMWANDTIDRELRIWQASDGTFCSNVADHGRFVTFAGASPGNTATLPAG